VNNHLQQHYLYFHNPRKRTMTAVDSQTMAITKDNDNAQVSILKAPSDGSEGLLDKFSLNPLTYFRKGNRKNPLSRTKGSSTNNPPASPSPKNNSPPKGPAHPRRFPSNLIVGGAGGAIQPTNASDTNKGKVKNGN